MGAQIKFWRATKSKTFTIFSFPIEHFKIYLEEGARAPYLQNVWTDRLQNFSIKSLMLNVNQLIYIMIIKNLKKLEKS